MRVKAGPPDPRFFHILEKYAAGGISAANAAFEIQAMQLKGYEDPSASEVVLWSQMAGFGIPSVSREEAEQEAEAIRRRMRDED